MLFMNLDDVIFRWFLPIMERHRRSQCELFFLFLLSVLLKMRVSCSLNTMCGLHQPYHVCVLNTRNISRAHEFRGKEVVHFIEKKKNEKTRKAMISRIATVSIIIFGWATFGVWRWRSYSSTMRVSFENLVLLSSINDKIFFALRRKFIKIKNNNF